MKTLKKAKKLVRVYLDADETEMLAEAMKSFENWAESDVMSLVMSAGLRAMKEGNYRFTWPLVLRVSDEAEPKRTSYSLNDPTSKGRK